jgi:hypothetical protein
MAAGMSGADATTGPASATRQDYGTIVVCGGGCYGSYYVRQLGRAAARGALRWRAVLVVDRDPLCRVAREQRAASGSAHDARDAPTPRVVAAEWGAFLDEYLAAASADPDEARLDAIVPSPLMPHLAYEWMLRRARARWPGRAIETRPLAAPPPTPWERAAPDGTHYVSYATWMCPINCVEPARCPHTRGTRDWSMPEGVRAYVAARRSAGEAIAGPAILHCVHRAFGVGMFDTADVLAAERLVVDAGTTGPAQVLVGTVSHCHGALNLLSMGPPPSALPIAPGRRDI